jgi:hypothetical protein
MKAKKGFRLRTVCGEKMIVAEGIENIDFSNIIYMNDTAAFLWENIQPMEAFTADTLAQLILDEYGDQEHVTREVAQNDAKQVLEQWIDAGIVEQ